MLTKIVFLILISTQVLATLPQLSFKNINGEYIMGKGSAHVMNACYKIENVELTHDDMGVKFNKAQKNLVLHGPNTMVHFGFDFSFLNVFKALKFNGVDLTLKDKKFLTTSTEIYTAIGKYDYTATDVSINAEILNMGDFDSMNQILKSFIAKGLVRIKKISYSPTTKEQFVKELIFDKVEMKKFLVAEKLIQASLRWLKLEIKEGKISGSVLVDSWINAWLRFNGTIEHIKESKILRIQLTRAKLGYFSVKRFVFKALRKLESDKIKVKGNVIEISID